MTTILRQRMHHDLQLAGLSERTQEAHLRAVRQLADHFHTPPDRLSEPQLCDYLLHLRERPQARLRLAHRRLLRHQVLLLPHRAARLDHPGEAPRPPRQDAPRRALRRRGRRLIEAVRTPHNRAYFWTVYSLGLRLGGGLNLQDRDIDGARLMVHVHRGKGAKDRYVPLPSRTLKVLRAYWATHRHPVWLFPATGRDHQQAASADGPMQRLAGGVTELEGMLPDRWAAAHSECVLEHRLEESRRKAARTKEVRKHRRDGQARKG